MRNRTREPKTTKPTKTGGKVGSGKADKTAEYKANPTPSVDGPQDVWMAATPTTLIQQIQHYRTLFPRRALPASIQQGLGRCWGQSLFPQGVPQ